MRVIRQMKKYNYDLGIIGGMGPAATAEIFQRIVSKTKASKDQEHMRICLLNNTIIPDRSKYLLEHGDNPLPYLKKNVRQLMKLRVKSFIIACNTAHYFIDNLHYNHRKMTFYSIIDETVAYIKTHFLDYKVCILATKGTVNTKVYAQKLDELSIQQIRLNEIEQEKMMAVINMTKAGLPKQEIFKTLESVVKNVSKQEEKCLFVLGCTELSLYKADLSTQYNVIDAMDILIEKVIVANHFELN